MKAAVVREFGGPDAMSVEDIAAPEPAAHELLLNVTACGVNFPDVLMIAGKYQHQPSLPFVPGIEFCGTVRAMGVDVADFEIGERVMAIAPHGGLAEQACVAANSVIRVPEHIDDVLAAALAVAYGTSYHALRQRAVLAKSESLLVLGAAGGVGLAAVEIGKLLGAHVIAAASSQEKLAMAESRGADELIDYTRTDLKTAVRACTAGRGVDVVFDPVGGELSEQALRCMRWNGRLLIIGFASGRIPAIPANLPLLKGCSVVGVFWGRFTEQEPKAHARNVAELLDYLEEGSLTPCISRVYPLEEAPAALASLAERRALGKIVVTM